MNEREPIVNQIVNLILREEGVDMNQSMAPVHVALMAKHACELVAVIALAAKITGGGEEEIIDAIFKDARRAYRGLNATYTTAELMGRVKP
jgi:hypothetical protein